MLSSVYRVSQIDLHRMVEADNRLIENSTLAIVNDRIVGTRNRFRRLDSGHKLLPVARNQRWRVNNPSSIFKITDPKGYPLFCGMVGARSMNV